MLEVTYIAMPSPLCMLCAVAIEHGHQFLGNWERGLEVDDSCYRKEDLHQQSTHGCLDFLSWAVQEELCTLLGENVQYSVTWEVQSAVADLHEGKPLLQLLHREHLDTDKAHPFNDGDDGCCTMDGVPDLQEEAVSDRMEPGLTQYTNHLCIEVSNLPHVSHIWVGVGPT